MAFSTPDAQCMTARVTTRHRPTPTAARAARGCAVNKLTDVREGIEAPHGPCSRVDELKYPEILLEAIARKHGLRVHDRPSLHGSDVYRFILAGET